MLRLAKSIDKLNEWIGKAASLLSILLVAVIIVDVFLRYVFNTTSVASAEFEWHLFALIFLLGSAWTLKNDGHVRVDLFYQNFSEKRKAWINLLGCLFLLLPFCYVGFSESLSFVRSSYIVGETSPDPGGLPARYLIKAVIPTGFFLTGLQGISMLLTNLKTIASR